MISFWFFSWRFAVLVVEAGIRLAAWPASSGSMTRGMGQIRSHLEGFFGVQPSLVMWLLRVNRENKWNHAGAMEELLKRLDLMASAQSGDKG